MRRRRSTRRCVSKASFYLAFPPPRLTFPGAALSASLPMVPGGQLGVLSSDNAEMPTLASSKSYETRPGYPARLLNCPAQPEESGSVGQPAARPDRPALAIVGIADGQRGGRDRAYRVAAAWRAEAGR